MNITDREKLQQIYLWCKILTENPEDCTRLTAVSTIEGIFKFLDQGKYQPSGRPCFDKPAGTPIEHWETEE